jgi:hypothetical protein
MSAPHYLPVRGSAASACSARYQKSATRNRRKLRVDQNSAFLRRLLQIAEGPCSANERGAQASDLLRAHLARFYSRLDIGRSNRLTPRVKSAADHVLDDLRLKVLTAEARADDVSADVFRTVRHHIDMSRRSLALRAVAEDQAERLYDAQPAGKLSEANLRLSTNQARQRDWELINAMRKRLADRTQIERSRLAIAESLRLLGATVFVAARPWHFAEPKSAATGRTDLPLTPARLAAPRALGKLQRPADDVVLKHVVGDFGLAGAHAAPHGDACRVNRVRVA